MDWNEGLLNACDAQLSRDRMVLSHHDHCGLCLANGSAVNGLL